MLIIATTELTSMEDNPEQIKNFMTSFQEDQMRMKKDLSSVHLFPNQTGLKLH